MTPGVAKSFAMGGVLYVIYLIDRSVAAKNNGVGLLSRLFAGVIDKGMSNEELYAMMEASRQNVMEHYELKQRPIQRVIYPEYGHLEYPDTNALGVPILLILMDYRLTTSLPKPNVLNRCGNERGGRVLCRYTR
jgi:hypothetical protein